MTVQTSIQFPYNETIREVAQFFGKELSSDTVLYLAEVIENLGTIANEYLRPVVDDFLCQKYSLLNQDLSKDSFHEYQFRLPLIAAMAAIGNPISSYGEYLETELKSQFPHVRFQAAKLCLEQNYLREDAVGILNEFVASGVGERYCSSAKVVLYECEVTDSILQDFINDDRAGGSWSVVEKRILGHAIRKEGVNHLSHDDFSYLAISVGLYICDPPEPLLPSLFAARKFEDKKQKLDVLIELLKQGARIDVLVDFLSEDEIALLEKDNTSIAVYFLRYFKNQNKPQERYFEDQGDFSLRLFDAHISEAPNFLRSKSFADAEKRLFLILDRVKDFDLEDDYVAGALVRPFKELAIQVHQLGVMAIPVLVSEIDNEYPDWVSPFLFQCLALFEPGEVERFFPVLANFFLEEEGGSVAWLASSLFEDYGVQAALFLVERLKKSDKPLEQNHILRTLSGILKS